MNRNSDSMTITSLLHDRLEEDSQVAARFHRSPSREWIGQTWSEFWDEVRNVSAALRHMGLGKGDRLAILSHTCPQWQTAEMAGLLAGAVIVGIDPHATPNDVAYLLKHSETSCLVVDTTENAEKIPTDILGELKFVVHLDPTATRPGERWRRWDEMTSGFEKRDDSCLPNVAADDSAILLYTSGTTGRPKAIEYSHHQIMIACRAIGHFFPEITRSDSMLCWLPMAHLFQRMMNLVAIDCGAKTYFVQNPREIMECVCEVRPSVFVAVPRFYEKLHENIMQTVSSSPWWIKATFGAALRCGMARAECEREQKKIPLGLRIRHGILDRLALRKVRDVMGGNMKFMVTGSSPTPQWLLEFLHGIGLLVLEAYGISENTVPMAANRPTCYRFGSVGKPFPQNEIRITADGEIQMRGPGVLKHYYHGKDADSRLTEDGFWQTGDIGHVDPDGFLYLSGRTVDILKTSTGRRISPTPIAATYCRSPYIDQMVVLGNGRKYLVGLVAVCQTALCEKLGKPELHLDPASDSSGDLETVESLIRREIEFYGRNLARHERIADFAILPRPLSVASGELTPTLKIRRDRVSELHAELIERMYAQPNEPCLDTSTSRPLEKLPT
ncbi:MAG: AMP-binding protein [Pirellulales bacterium]|nr:AMP-binding protein [Pirellulales bacterium]